MDYDNTDRGALFPALEGQSLILTGKIDNAGDARPHAIVKDTDRDGNDVLVIYKRVGVLYSNDDATPENKKPHYSGPIDNNRRISAWRSEKGNMKYLSAKISDKMQQADTAIKPATSGDIPDIPF